MTSSWISNTDVVYWIRVVLLWINTLFFVLPHLHNSSLLNNFLWFTRWGVNLTELALITSVWAMQYHEYVIYTIDFKYLAIWLNSTAQAVNLVVTVVSWIAIIPWYWFNVGWDTFDNVMRQINSMTVHTVPLILTTINIFLLSDTAFKVTDSWLVPLVSVSYLLISWIYTKSTGEYLYYFLTWQDVETTLPFAIGVVTSGLVVYLLDCLLT